MSFKAFPGFRQLAFVLVFGAAAGAAFFVVERVPGPVVDRLIRLEVERLADKWREIVLSEIDDPEQVFASGFVSPQTSAQLNLIPRASDAFRFKLFRPNGTVFWSTRPTDVGNINTHDYYEEIVAQGGNYYLAEYAHPSEVFGLTLPPGKGTGLRYVTEVYRPVMSDGGFAGAMEFYADMTDMRAAYMAVVTPVLGGLMGLGLLMLAVVAGAIARSGSLQMREIEKRAEKEQELLGQQVQLAREVKLLGELNEWLQSSRSLDELFDMVAQFLSHLLPNGEGSLYVYSNSRDVLDGVASWNCGTHQAHIRPQDCWGLRRGRTYAFGRSEVDFPCAHVEDETGRPYFCFPILAHGETVGLLHIRAREGVTAERFRDEQRLAQVCAEQISMAIANVRMRDELRDQSVRDPLTGLFNRRHMAETLRKMVTMASRGGAPLAVVSVDVDHFKKFNDTHGHDAGDIALRSVGSALEQFCQGAETACRVGGEEFLLLLPGVDTAEAGKRLEALRRRIEEISVRYGGRLLPNITASFGLAHYPNHGDNPTDLIRSSDEALYAAKAKGRNRVEVAGGDEDAEGKAAPKAHVKGGTPAPVEVRPDVAAE